MEKIQEKKEEKKIMPIDPNIQAQYTAESSLQQQKIDAETGVQSPYLLQERQNTQAALLEQLNPSRVIENIELAFRGKIKDLITGEIKQIRTPLMNEIGIGAFIVSVSSVVNPITTISALDEKMINKLVNEMDRRHRRLLKFNWIQYGAKQYDFDLICDVCINLSYPCLRRSLQGGERGFLGRITMETISSPRTAPIQPQQKWYHKFKL